MAQMDSPRRKEFLIHAKASDLRLKRTAHRLETKLDKLFNYMYMCHFVTRLITRPWFVR
jgi:hypothetical protein